MNVQSLINTALLWCNDFDSSNKEDYLNIEKKKKKKKKKKKVIIISKGT